VGDVFVGLLGTDPQQAVARYPRCADFLRVAHDLLGHEEFTRDTVAKLEAHALRLGIGKSKFRSLNAGDAVQLLSSQSEAGLATVENKADTNRTAKADTRSVSGIVDPDTQRLVDHVNKVHQSRSLKHGELSKIARKMCNQDRTAADALLRSYRRHRDHVIAPSAATPKRTK